MGNYSFCTKTIPQISKCASSKDAQSVLYMWCLLEIHALDVSAGFMKSNIFQVSLFWEESLQEGILEQM
jgi:hypothetical protein